MTEFDMIFYTNYYVDGYELGINLQIDKAISSFDYVHFYNKIATVFRCFNYGMDVAKITEVLKTILINNGVKEEQITRLYVTILNKKDNIQSTDIIGVKNGNLGSVITADDLYKDRETLSIAYDHGKLYSYYYSNENKKFIFKNNKLSLEYVGLPENTKTKNDLLNRIMKDNLKTLSCLENVVGDKFYSGINTSDKILVSAYRLFYGEHPNFNKQDIITKIQCMVAILSASGIDLFPSVSEDNYNETDIECPESISVRDQIFKLTVLLGNNFSKIKEFTFNSNTTKKIELLGGTINNYMLQMPEEERTTFLKQFSVEYIRTFSIYIDKPIGVIEERTQELMRLLTKKDSKN